MEEISKYCTLVGTKIKHSDFIFALLFERKARRKFFARPLSDNNTHSAKIKNSPMTSGSTAKKTLSVGIIPLFSGRDPLPPSGGVGGGE